ncbi:MAG: hypothetical protein HKP58_01195 [Desulfatitalea sp.]|nr:hypothetical protein [Desulfatitalea sp.]NNJ99002.1 hypothetical protein [Desulfatitalea sp.]
MKAIYALIVGIFCLSALPAQADVTGAGDAAVIARLTVIYETLKEQYEKQLKLIREAKIQNENMIKVRETAVMVKKEYDFARNFNLERELDQIKHDIGNLTLLDNMDGKSDETKFKMLAKEIERRFENDPSLSSVNAKRKLASQVAALERFNALRKAKTGEAKDLASGAKTDKETQASAASSCALIAALELAREERRIREEMEKTETELENENLEQDYIDVLERMADK